jgi:hypothetical protein
LIPGFDSDSDPIRAPRSRPRAGRGAVSPPAPGFSGRPRVATIDDLAEQLDAVFAGITVIEP